MQFSIERDAFLKELSRVTGVIEPRTTIPICTHVRIDAGAGGLMLRATDLEMEAETICAADVTTTGITTVNGKILLDFVKRCPEGSRIAATWDAANERLRLVCGRIRAMFPTLPDANFPQLGQHDGEQLTINAASLKHMIKQTRFAASTVETDHVFQGLYFAKADPYLVGDGNYLVGVATDRHQFSLVHLPAPEHIDNLKGVILPPKLLGELARLLPDDGDACLTLSETRIVVTIGDFWISSALIDATFPAQYARVIPKDTKNLAFVERDEFMAAVERVSIALSKNIFPLQLTFGAGEIRLAAASNERGNCFDIVDLDYDGDEIRCHVDARYLTNILNTLRCERIRLEFEDDIATGSAAFKLTDADDPHPLDCMVLMPMKNIPAIREERCAA